MMSKIIFFPILNHIQTRNDSQKGCKVKKSFFWVNEIRKWNLKRFM